MVLRHWKVSVISCLLVMCQLSYAQTADEIETFKVTACLSQKIRIPHEILAKNAKYQIITINTKNVDDFAKQAKQEDCPGFVNLTPKIKPGKSLNKREALKLLTQPETIQSKGFSVFQSISHAEEVNQNLEKIDSNNIWQTLTHLTSYYNRSATEDTGVDTAKWIEKQFKSMATVYGRSDTDSYFVKTGWYYKQPSLVTVIGKDIDAPAIVIGAHMDTLSGRMPGAGDDGSGSSSILEAARVLLSSDVKLKHPVYFIWYAAEERGLVGSQYVVKDFLKKEIPVKAVVQFDMTGFRNDMSDRTMWLYTDYTDKDLTSYLADLINTYIKVPLKYSRCGYGCSDHASWMEEGIPAAFPCETNFEQHNPYIHTSMDSMEHLSLDHMTNFSKLALAFAIEMAAE